MTSDLSQAQIQDSHVLMQLYTMPVVEREFEEASVLQVKRKFLLQ